MHLGANAVNASTKRSCSLTRVESGGAVNRSAFHCRGMVGPVDEGIARMLHRDPGQAIDFREEAAIISSA